MDTVRVVKQKDEPTAEYIGRGTPLGNPFVMSNESFRDRVVDWYDEWLHRALEACDIKVVQQLARLYGKALNGGVMLGCHCAPLRCHGDVVKDTLEFLLKERTGIFASPSHGYEVSSKGDSRFSAFYAKMADGRSLEAHYQCDDIGKGYAPGSTDWKLGKGKPPKNGKTPDQLYAGYLGLWREWSTGKEQLLDELYACAVLSDFCLTDRFATTPTNQAVALVELINERSRFLTEQSDQKSTEG